MEAPVSLELIVTKKPCRMLGTCRNTGNSNFESVIAPCGDRSGLVI